MTSTLNRLGDTAYQSSRSIRRADFRRLGLRRREARVDVIREATTRVAAGIRDSEQSERLEGSFDIEHEQLASVVVSAYRLLDPRLRSNMVERIQLLILPETDGMATTQGRSPHLASYHLGGDWDEQSEFVGREVIPSRRSALETNALNEHGFDVDSLEVLAAQDVIDFLRQRDRHAKIRLLALAALISTCFLAAAMLLLS